MRCSVKFRFRGPRGTVAARGATANVSSHGLLLETPTPVPPASQIEAVVGLGPEGGPAISLLSVQGVVLRCDNGKVAVDVKKHRLRPLKRDNLAALPR